MIAQLTLPAYQEEVEQFVHRAVKTLRPDCIILHGSYARGTQTETSDIDLIVVGGRLVDDFLERLEQLGRLRDGRAPLEVIGYTLPEWEQMMAARHLTVLEALHWGRPLYGKELFAQWQETLEAWKALGLRREQDSWVVPPGLRSTPPA